MIKLRWSHWWPLIHWDGGLIKRGNLDAETDTERMPGEDWSSKGLLKARREAWKRCFSSAFREGVAIPRPPSQTSSSRTVRSRISIVWGTHLWHFVVAALGNWYIHQGCLVCDKAVTWDTNSETKICIQEVDQECSWGKSLGQDWAVGKGELQGSCTRGLLQNLWETGSGMVLLICAKLSLTPGPLCPHMDRSLKVVYP